MSVMAGAFVRMGLEMTCVGKAGSPRSLPS